MGSTRELGVRDVVGARGVRGLRACAEGAEGVGCVRGLGVWEVGGVEGL